MKISLPSSSLQSAVLAYGVFAGALMAYNIRWKYLGDIFGSKAKSLPITKVEGTDDPKKKKKPVIVLLHGMWHDAAWYSDLQSFLKARGYTSYAVDLLPGERLLPGFSQKEIVADLEKTLLDDKEDGVEYILLGHSQGGLVVQTCLLNSPGIKSRTKASVLLGTYPLGLTPPICKLLLQDRNMYAHYGYAGICLTGKIITLGYLKHIFLMPTTDPKGTHALADYTTKILNAPSDGLITMSHFPQKVGAISTKPTLVLGAEGDIIYHPHLIKDDFQSRFPNATQATVPNQAHCFMDPVQDGDPDFKDVLANWLDEITA